MAWLRARTQALHVVCGRTQQRGVMKKQYSFPILEDDDILLCLRELQVNAQEADLVNPTPQTVHSIYTHFLDILMNVTRDDLMQPQFTSTLEHPELHEDSIPMLTFLRAWCGSGRLSPPPRPLPRARAPWRSWQL